MLRTRIIPVLLLHDESLVKTTRFGKFNYIGDPQNTMRIFNALEVDELMLLDISATKNNRKPNFSLLKDVANECFMPVGYGGGIRCIEDAKTILHMGFEKIVINSYALEEPEFISELAEHFGSQAIVISIDIRRNMLGQYHVYGHHGEGKYPHTALSWAKKVTALGAGEILLTSIDREGTWQGLDHNLIKSIAEAVNIPVIAHGGANSLNDIQQAMHVASAVALGSMVVYQKKNMGVLINFPDTTQLIEDR